MSNDLLSIIIETAAKAIGVIVPVLVGLAPIALPGVVQKIDENHRRRLLAATKAAVLIIGEVASRTATNVDDSLIEVLRLVEKEIGRSLRPAETRLVRSMATSLHADPRFPARLAPSITVVGKD